MLDMGTDPDLLRGEPLPSVLCVNGTKAAEIVHIRGHQSTIAEETCLQTHLHKGHIGVNSLCSRLLDIIIRKACHLHPVSLGIP